MSQHSQSSDPLADFGANEWLVDEMYDRYLEDKSSVDRRSGRPSSPTTSPTAPAARNGASAASDGSPPPGRAAARSTAPPSDASPSRAEQAPRAAGAGRAGQPAGPTAARPSRDQPATTAPATTKPAAAAAAIRTPRAAPLRGAGRPGRRQHGDQPDRPDRDQRAGRAGQAADRQPGRRQQPPGPQPRRQGLVHPPHRLRRGQGRHGDAGDEPRLRRDRRQALGRHARATSTSAWPSTSPSPDGSRPLLVPNIKRAETMDFAQFWTAYEDIVRRARDEQAHR